MSLLFNLYLIRHGETDWNKEKKFQGHTDIPLNFEGESQAESLSHKIKHFDIHHIFSSDLGRAFKTAQMALAHHFAKNPQLDIPKSHHLRETNLGVAEGHYFEKFPEIFGKKEFDLWKSNDLADWNFAFPQGESKFEVCKRVMGFLEEKMKELVHNKDTVKLPSERNMLIFTHGGVIRNLTTFVNPKLNPVAITNCCIHHFQYDSKSGKWSYIKEIL